MDNAIPINISVGDLVNFILRSGDIDPAYMGAKRMQEGIAAHKIVQGRRKKEAASAGHVYESEVTLKYSFIYKNFLYNVEGRADGILLSDGLTIEEIKSTLKPLHEIGEASEIHAAQAKCYAYMYRELFHFEGETGIRVTYVGLESYETAEFYINTGAEELRAFFYGLAEKYYEFASMDAERIKLRDATAAALGFPFAEYRKNQREFMAAVYGAVKKQKNLFAQAPTGTGKTISTLFPAVKALAGGECEKIFYLTAKTLTRQAAQDAFALMSENGLILRAATLTAKDKICFTVGAACSPESCEYAKGHFDRVNPAIKDIVENETNITRGVVESYARKHAVCPFEFELDVTLFCDAVICDYNYVFNPKAQLKRFFGEPGKRGFALLIDEAHNLVERARDMFSAGLRFEPFVAVRRALKEKKTPLRQSMTDIIKYFRDIKGSYLTERKQAVSDAAPAELRALITEFCSRADEWLVENQSHPDVADMTELYFDALDFLRVSELFDSRYRLFIDGTFKNDVTVKLLCLDPSFLISKTLCKVKSSVFFSATLTPLFYFKNVLGGTEEDLTLRIPSPFDAGNLLLLVENGVSVKYRDRIKNAAYVSDSIYHFVTAKTGNYFVFFSSYEYLTLVLADFTERHPDIETVSQKQDMPEEEREAFLEKFAPAPEKTLAGFLVLGGIFSEGIDLKADRLIGAAIVGVGLPLITVERNVVSDYYQEVNGRGFDYAYAFPGMNKVLQAAGRVIRQETDAGSVLLIDSRFLSEPYAGLFPPEWSGYRRTRGITGMKKELEEFWNAKGK